MRFDDIKGIAYRLFSAGGHIIVLTSHAIYLLVDLARRFLSGEPVDRQPTYMRVRAIEAVDANLVDGHWLLTVTPDSVLRFDLNLVAGAQGEVGRFEEPREVGATSIQTRWEALPLMSSETEASLIPA
jgi:hypothetical protein